MDISAIVKEVMKELEKKEINQLDPLKSRQTIQDSKPFSGGRTIEYTKEKLVGVENPSDRGMIEKLRAITPARIGIGHTGTRMKTREYLDFRIDHAAAQDAVFRDVSEDFLKQLNLPILISKSVSMDDYLMNVDSGRKLDPDSAKWAEAHLPKNKQVQIIISDGLSSTGIEANIGDILPALIQGLEVKKVSVGQPVFIKRSRVWIQDEIARITNCDVVISLIGERPGLATSKSISAYMIYRPGKESVEADRTVISNIHDGGIPPVEAGAYLADLLADILKHKASGVKYAHLK
ncbi:ethanolamine ammonia-lyase subunit EutC [Mesobacillus subterraneus]|uniref:ethanolamine ammonia-lyase subunit EutC n=1 Tax=Mesobacillus subterraneus TaxID=285983 RepID=UPI00203B2D3B|nr:ethanolamine ammonia-lyase subunit EutC [Mesobacillus subterraneus]MCM3572302.1 ethanolamine ammonia-lyase subunit EutC [Mesobacillus subterraneus]